MPLVATPARLNLLHACDQWHYSRIHDFTVATVKFVPTLKATTALTATPTPTLTLTLTLTLNMNSPQTLKAYHLYQSAATKLRKDFRFFYTFAEVEKANYGNPKAGTLTAFKSKFYLTSFDKSSTSTVLSDTTTVELLTEFLRKSYSSVIGKQTTTSQAPGAHMYGRLLFLGLNRNLRLFGNG